MKMNLKVDTQGCYETQYPLLLFFVHVNCLTVFFDVLTIFEESDGIFVIGVFFFGPCRFFNEQFLTEI